MTIRKITLVLAVVLLAGAQTTAIVPPREYDHPYSGHLIVQRMSEPDIRRTCYNNDLKPGHQIECPFKPGADMDTFPPPKYDYLFPGPIIITRKANLDELNKVCGGNRLIGACATRIAYTCQIYMLSDKDLADFAMSFKATVRHEIGHCNGWPGTHPDRRWSVSDWYDLPPQQIFEGPPLAEQLIQLAKGHRRQMK